MGEWDSPERARREFVAALGGMRAIDIALGELMRPRAQDMFGREIGDEQLQRWVNEVRLLALAEWPTAPAGTPPPAHLDALVDRWAAELRQDAKLSFCFISVVLPSLTAFLAGIGILMAASMLRPEPTSIVEDAHTWERVGRGWEND